MHSLLVVADARRWRMHLRVRNLGRIQPEKVRVVKPLGRIVCDFTSSCPGCRARVVLGPLLKDEYQGRLHRRLDGEGAIPRAETSTDEQPYHADRMNHHRQQLPNVNHIAIDLEQ